jgi:methylmalonyl-CoA/ethylmalonyl-CoA epimerase
MTETAGPVNKPVEFRNGAHSVATPRLGPLLEGKAVIHHLGFVVPSISSAAEDFAVSMSARWDGQIVYDPSQRVRVAFFSPADSRNPVYELVEPADTDSPVSSFINRPGGLHHVCYEIDDLVSVLREAVDSGFAIVSDPTPAVAFDGRRIAWVCSKRRFLIEFLERVRP